MGTRYLITLGWGLGDVLCSTPALRVLKKREPDCEIIFRTHVKGRRRLEYDARGAPAGSGGAPDEMLWDNPNIDRIIDFAERAPPHDREVNLLYAWTGGPSLDIPLQARMFQILDLPFHNQTRFDADYFLRPYEREDALALLMKENKWGSAHLCVLTPRVGWPGKAWMDAGWEGIMDELRRAGWLPVILAGEKLTGPPWDRGLNLTGQLDIRKTAAILDRCRAMLCTEGGLSNLRFALRKPAVVLTCSTQYGIQVWAPPELCTEVRNPHFCEPCMWRLRHVKGEPSVPPGNIKDCPKGHSLRDLTAADVWPILREHLEKAQGCPQ